MTDRLADLETALDRVVAAAKSHLAAVAAGGDRDDDTVWAAYVALNNTAHAYDSLLNEIFGEVTPWDLETMSADDADTSTSLVSPELKAPGGDDPYPKVISVRQRRDYRVPSVAALLRVAEELRGGPDEEDEPITDIGEAVVELLSAGDGSLAMLDLPELEPLDGVVVVIEAEAPLDPDAHPDDDAVSPFQLAPGERITSRVDERALPEPA